MSDSPSEFGGRNLGDLNGMNLKVVCDQVFTVLNISLASYATEKINSHHIRQPISVPLYLTNYRRGALFPCGYSSHYLSSFSEKNG